jgi:hypothetical protein
MPITNVRALKKYREEGSAGVYGMIRTYIGPNDHSDVDCLHKIRGGKGSLYCKLEVAVIHSNLHMQQKTADCHSETNGEKDVRWLQEQLIPNSEQNSLLEIDSGLSPNKQNDKVGNDKELVMREKY